MRAKIYGISASHPVRTATLMLDRKGIEWERTDLAIGIARPVLRALGFPGVTVPAIVLDGDKIQTNRTLARVLEERVPDPPLYPADPAARAAVEQAEIWGDEVLQVLIRRLSYSILTRDRSRVGTFFDGPVMGLPPALAARTAGPILALGKRLNGVSDDTTRGDLSALPVAVDRVDSLIADGVIGGPEPNVADFQIFPSISLMLCFEDFRGPFGDRPAAQHARRVVGEYPGDAPAALPREWVARLHA